MRGASSPDFHHGAPPAARPRWRGLQVRVDHAEGRGGRRVQMTPGSKEHAAGSRSRSHAPGQSSPSAHRRLV